MNEKIEKWCELHKCSDLTFLRTFNIPSSLHFYLKNPPKFESKTYQKLKETISHALEQDVNADVVELIQEFSQKYHLSTSGI